jgi:hypothetical protein
MTPQDLAALTALIHDSLKDSDHYNKVVVGTFTVLGAFLGVVLGVIIQYLNALWQRRSTERIALGGEALQREVTKDQLDLQEALARSQADLQRGLLDDQLAMQKTIAERAAIDNVSAKRQSWINDLRDDMAAYLTLQQEIAYAWHAAIFKNQNPHEASKQVSPDDHSAKISPLHKDALENELRIFLRLNPDEEKHVDLRHCMEKLTATIQEFKRNNPKNHHIDVLLLTTREVINECVSKTQRILKEEWIRVKEGRM